MLHHGRLGATLVRNHERGASPCRDVAASRASAMAGRRTAREIDYPHACVTLQTAADVFEKQGHHARIWRLMDDGSGESRTK